MMAWMRNRLLTSRPRPQPAAASPWGDGPLTWVTNCCQQERPDERVDVVHVPITGHEEHFPAMRMNYRYCNDRAGCISRAMGAAKRGARP